MNFLKKWGTIALKIIGIASGLLPLIAPAVASSPAEAKVVDKLEAAIGAIGTAEQMFTAAYGSDAKMGPDKLKAAAPYVGALLQSVGAVSGKKPKDEAKAEAAIAGVTSNLADFLSAYEE